MIIAWAVEVDWDRNGSYEADITGDVELPGQGISIDRGFDRDGLYHASRVSITVSNRAGTYWPGNTGSARLGQLRPLTPIRVRATHNAIPYTLWTGYIMGYRITGQAAGKVPTCTFECTDLAGILADVTPIDVLLATDRDTGEAYTAIAVAAGLTGADYNFPAGAQALPVHWVRGKNALEAMQDVLASEMGGSWFVDGLGVIQGEPRTVRTGTTVDDTWGDGTGIFPRAAALEINPQDLVSSVDVQATIMVADEADQVWFVFSRNASNPTPDSISILAGASYEVVIDTPSPLEALTTPVASTDYAANTTISGTGTDMTASLSVTATLLGAAVGIQLRNTHASTTLYVTKFQLRGLRRDFAVDRPVFAVAKTIPGDKTSRGIQLQVPYADDSTTTRDYAMALLRTWRYEPPRLLLTFDASTDAKKVALLGVELGKLVRYKDTALTTDGTYSDDWYYVERIQHAIPPNLAGQTFQSVVTLIPSYQFRKLANIEFDMFDRANVVGDLGTAASGAVWANDGNMDIDSNAARANSDTLQMPNLDLGSGATDQIAEVSLAAIGAGDEVGLVLRYTDASNQIRVYLDKGSNEVIAEKNVATVVTELASPAFAVGTSHELRAMVQDTRLRVWVDRVPYIDVTTAPTGAATKAGLFARNASGTTTFDDFYGQSL